MIKAILKNITAATTNNAATSTSKTCGKNGIITPKIKATKPRRIKLAIIILIEWLIFPTTGISSISIGRGV